MVVLDYTPLPQKQIQLLLDGEPWRKIHTTIFGMPPKLPSAQTTFQDLLKEFKALEYKRAKNYALNRLAAQAYPSTLLHRRLTERLVSKEAADKVISEFLSKGYLDDQAWVESFVRVQLARKKGIRRIALELKNKGLPPSLIDEVVDSNQSQHETITYLLTTKYKNRDLTNHKERQRTIAALIRRGFDLDETMASVRNRLLLAK